ncbi:MAG TPA: hypothetical protein VIS48_02980 [Candidatus Kryptonia bacterium]
MDTFFAMNVQRAAVQALESLYIIASSKNLETIESRYNFLLMIPQGLNESVTGTLRSAQNNPQYPTLIQGAISQHKTMYPNSILQDYQFSFLKNPDKFDLNEFYCTSLVNAMKRFSGARLAEIETLKNESAKTRRVAKIIETIKLVQAELQQKCSGASSYSTAVNELDKLETEMGAKA